MAIRLVLIGSWAMLVGLEATGAEPAPQRRPNILIFLADDMGFSDPGCYGGEIETPHLDALAAGGLRFTQFYNTGRCWPTRTCLLTGYYAQQVRMDPPRGRMPPWARLLPHHLKPLGYRSYHSGKWHILGAPKALADGGFDRAYIVHDQDRYFNPQRHEEDDQPLPPVQPASGYYKTTAIADHAIRCLKEHAERHADQPFFSYIAFTAPHFPLHAPQEDIDRYRQRYLEGWDAVRLRRHAHLETLGIVKTALRAADSALTPRYFQPQFLDELGAGELERAIDWESLTGAQQEFQAMKMAIHAAMVDRMDREIGRVLEQLRAMEAFDDTLIFFLSDNGADATILIRGDRHDPAAAPGSAGSYLCIGPGWATASNSPFHRHKIWVHEGGIATPLIVHWPAGVRGAGTLRHDLGHAIDIVPTILDLLKAAPSFPSEAPPLPGRSLAPLLTEASTVERESLFFHHEGNRALRMGNWKIVSATEDGDGWQLYDLSRDRGETTDLAEKHPQRVRRMAEQWQTLQDEYSRAAGHP
jgi:arylsulfatase A-like enzyme